MEKNWGDTPSATLRDYEETKKVPTDRKTLFVFNKLMDFLNGGKKK